MDSHRLPMVTLVLERSQGMGKDRNPRIESFSIEVLLIPTSPQRQSILLDQLNAVAIQDSFRESSTARIVAVPSA